MPDNFHLQVLLKVIMDLSVTRASYGYPWEGESDRIDDTSDEEE
jgi:hypothetical protein